MTPLHAQRAKFILIFTLTTISAIIIGYLYSGTRAASTLFDTPTGVSITIDNAIAARALEYAAERGLTVSGDAERDRAMIDMAISTTRAEWNNALKMEVSPDAIAAGYDLSQPVIVVVMRGQVDWGKGPGLPNPNEISPASLDNLYIVMDAKTGARIGSAAFNPEQTLPFYPDGTVAGGTPAQYREATPSEGVLPVPAAQQ